MSTWNKIENWAPLLDKFLENYLNDIQYKVLPEIEANKYMEANFHTDKLLSSIEKFSGLLVNKQDLFLELQERGYHYKYTNGTRIEWVAFKTID